MHGRLLSATTSCHAEVKRRRKLTRRRVEAAVSPAKRLNGADGISDIEGEATRVGASERGQ